jgi:hypothetical protein
MKLEKILQSRVNRRDRGGRPYANFVDTFNDLVDASNAVIDQKKELPHAPLLSRAIVITLVTSIEVYYKDMLDGIFRTCKPSFFKPVLRQLTNEKFDIDDLIQLHEQQIHPLELIASNQSFQNVSVIERVFSKFVGNGFWQRLFGIQVRLKESPDKVYDFKKQQLQSLDRIFKLRHELVHDPGKKYVLSGKTLEDITNSAWMIFGSDIVLSEVIHKNLDDEVANDLLKRSKEQNP